MGRVLATILYEDRRGPTRSFGLHKFIVACVFDRVGGERWQLDQALDGRPMKGDSKLLECVRDDAASIAADGRHIMAVFDDDRVRTLLRAAPNASDAEVCRELLCGCTLPPERVGVFLLKENTESILQAVGECGLEVSPELLAHALAKVRIARDLILNDAATLRNQAVRDCVLSRIAALRGVVDRAEALVRDGRAG